MRYHAFLAIKYYDGEQSKREIEEIKKEFNNIGIELFCVVSDVEKYGQVDLTGKNVMKEYSFKEIDNSDFSVIEFSEKGVGLGMIAGYCCGRKRPYFIIAKTGSEISSNIGQNTNGVIFYDDYQDLAIKFKKIALNSYQIYKGLKEQDLQLLLQAFILEAGNTITDCVRTFLDNSTDEEIDKIKVYMELLLENCFNNVDSEISKTLQSLTAEDMFRLKENIIYYLGRMKSPINLDLFKSIYDKEDNFYLKLNLMFSSLKTFDEYIETNFISKIKPGNEYDIKIRSWTMAFFKDIENPYDYRDNNLDDWSIAKAARMNRLKININTQLNYDKAMSFRFIDLIVLWLFLESRPNYALGDEDKEIIENSFIEDERFSKNKILEMKKAKERILGIIKA